MVTGVKHPKWEGRPIALVVLREEQKGKVSKEDILAHLSSRKFAKWQFWRQSCLLMPFPKPVSGKSTRKPSGNSTRTSIWEASRDSRVFFICWSRRIFYSQ
ncbi:MAG: hypothetical protein ABFD82_00055 [Syntrophaceae bacterium]